MCTHVPWLRFYMTHMQVVPTCTCPANVNVKDCCAGIMCALAAQKDRVTCWFGQNWFKRELLNRRHRADCDPFLEIAQMKPAKRTCSRHESQVEAPISLLVPTTVKNKFDRALKKAGNDQFLVRRPSHFLNVCVHTCLTWLTVTKIECNC